MPDLAPLLFALAAGTMSASYAILLRLGAGSINPALGALVISGVALPFTAIVFAILRVWHPGTTITTKGMSLMILAGIAAASQTVLALLAYASGFKLSSSPLITATQMSVVLLVGFVFLKEPFSIGRLLALILIVLGILVLQRQGV
jgi:uncharacterized membrane protein